MRHSCEGVDAEGVTGMLLCGAQVKLSFPRSGSKATPPHPSGDFKWKDYCPVAFRQLREVFSIDAAQYLTSICGESHRLKPLHMQLTF